MGLVTYYSRLGLAPPFPILVRFVLPYYTRRLFSRESWENEPDLLCLRTGLVAKQEVRRKREKTPATAY